MSSVHNPLRNLKGGAGGAQGLWVTTVCFLLVNGRGMELQERESLLEPGLRDDLRKWIPSPRRGNNSCSRRTLIDGREMG